MPGVFVYETKGYKSGVGWSSAASDLLVSDSSTFNSNNSAFYRTGSGWRRFYSYNTIPPDNVFDISVPTPASLQAVLTLNSNGGVNTFSTTVGWTNQGKWDNANHIDGEMEVYVSVVSNTVAVTGTLNSWVSLTSNRSWSISGTVDNDSRSAVLNFTLRHNPSGVNVYSKEVSFSIEAGTG